MGVATTRRGAAIAAALGVLLVVGGATAGRAWLRGPDDVPPVPPGSAAVHAKAEEVYSLIAGTPSQQAISAGLNHWAQNAELDRCMDAAGYPDWGGFGPIAQSVRDPLLEGTWLVQPHRRMLSLSLAASRRAVEWDAERNNVEIGVAEDAAITECIGTTTHASEREAMELSAPRHSRALWRAWGQMVFDYATADHDPDEYVECMIEADVPGLDPVLLREGGDISYAATGIDAPRGPVPASPEDPLAETEGWQDFLEAEQVAVDADWRCRAEVYTELIDGLLPLIEEFEAEHAEQLAQTETEWAEIEARAADVFG